MNLKKKKITIIGTKRSALAAAKLVLAQGGKPKLSEYLKAESISLQATEWIAEKKITFECGGHTQEFIEDSDILVISPGVRIGAEPVLWAQNKGIPVLSEIEFAFQFAHKPIIAVTGSNGKTTVVTLIHDILAKAGFNPCLCGNIGFPFSEFVLDETIDYFVLELSSFQLESFLDLKVLAQKQKEKGKKSLDIKGFKPYIALFLNFNQNHLDRHKDLDEYFDAKKKIFNNQGLTDFAILSYKDERIKALETQVDSQVRFFDTNEVSDSSDFRNQNQLAVLETAKILEIDKELCEDVFKNFKGVEHRLEWVRQVKGIDFVNDSKATTAESSRWALEHINKPIHMICGGRDKMMDFSVLSDLIRAKVKKMYVIGEAKEKLKNTFDDIVGVEECDKLETAVKKANDNAAEGDCVILSPMCASFDMFSDFEERGKVYKKIVNKLK